MSKLLFSFSVILFGLALGFTLQILIRKEKLRLPMEMNRLKRLVLRSALLTLLPVVVVGSVWSVKIDDPRIATLPFLGTFALCLGGVSALLISKLIGHGRPQTGSFFVCGAFTNLGGLGGLICYVFLGEAGFGLVPMYRLFEEFLYYLVGFSVAKYYGSGIRKEESLPGRLKKIVLDPLVMVSFSSLLTGGILNRSGIERPGVYRTVNAVLIPVITLIFLVSIGMEMKVRRIRSVIRECLLVSTIKFLVVPVFITALALCLGYRQVGGGLLLKTVIILSSMPVAFVALVPPSLYDLDVDLANSCWLFTTCAGLILLPLLYFIIELI